ncbi:MAG TPA: DMT family transporter [Tenuifilaceae bacterium]|nr:DMT family transporter [Tenuifilaceae bacterium]HPE18680.1 DMT family transporter [Tenuifilaceae bacterium]HPJ45547.1 DMT family transporter [Tenuifilaceae bacterium]HPQ33799.1 DMT family transporter [Tenuifilaceae bacterium]HRX68611.1 DMT family transporter [Tenuifilaceae bacterium]
MRIFLLVLTTIIWGSTFFIIKDAVITVNEFYIVFLRTFLAAIPMLLFVYLKNKKSLLNPKTILKGMVLGILLATTYASQTIGLKYTSSGHSAFITGAAVVIIPMILFFFYKRKLKSQEIIILLIVFAGLYLLTYDSETKINIGDLITLITTLSLAWHLTLAGRYVKNTETLPLIAYQFFFASLFSLIIYVSTQPVTFQLSTNETITMIYLGFIGTLFCYFVSVWAQKQVDTVTVAIIFTLEPVFAALFAWIFASETLNFKEISGGIIILGGIIIFQLLSIRKKQTELKLDY